MPRCSIPVVLAITLLTPAGADAQAKARLLDPPSSNDMAVARMELTLPELGRTLLDVRTPLADGTVLRTTVDAATGAPVDLDALRKQDHALGLARRRGMHPTLHSEVATRGPDELIEVAFWLIEPDDGTDWARWLGDQAAGLPEAIVGEAVRALRVDALEQNETRLAPRVSAFAERARQAGAEVVVEGLGWPLVIARLKVRDVAALSSDARVDIAYLSQPEWQGEGDQAQGTMRTYRVHDQGALADGSVRVLVNDVGQVEQNNIYLPPIITLNVDGNDSHATGVAGNIANLHPTYYAAAYTQPELYSAGGTGDSIAPPIWNNAITNGIDFGNCSWWNFLKGNIEFLDRFFDHTIRNFSVMMFKSNGNQGTSTPPYGTTPGQGYNMTCSGAYSDQNNIDPSDDAMASSSSYLDPNEGHRKPELSSPGTGVATTSLGTMGIQSSFGGTSSASPLTCGVATLVASSDNTLLAEMTTVKAVMMVSAWNNVEGDPTFSDKDGAGGIHAKAAHSVVRDGQWHHAVVTNADFPAGTYDVPMKLLRGEQTRVVALWFSQADSAYSTDVLDMDLDLVVLDPSGSPVASAASATDAFEIVSFTPTTTGTYVARLTRQRFDGASEPLTVAWSGRNDAGSAEVLHLAGGPNPAFSIGRAPRMGLRDRFVGAGNPYVAWASFKPPTGIPVGGGFVAPMGWDMLSAASLSYPNMVGVFPASGVQIAKFPILNDPALIGLYVGFGLVIFDATQTNVITVADPVAYPIEAPQ